MACDARVGNLPQFERVEVDGDSYCVKRLSPSSDWVMRVTGDHVHRPYLIWLAGLMKRVPECIDHTILAMQANGEGDNAILLDHVGSCCPATRRADRRSARLTRLASACL